MDWNNIIGDIPDFEQYSEINYDRKETERNREKIINDINNKQITYSESETI